MRMFQSRLTIMSALAANGGELVANGKGYLPTADQLAFFGQSKTGSALASQLAAMEADDMIVREMLPGARRTLAIRLSPIGWEVVRERGLYVEPEPEPVVVIVEPEPEPEALESDLVAAARHVLTMALAREHELLQADAMGERLAELANALDKALGAKCRVDVQLRDTMRDLRVKEAELRGVRIRLGRVERLLFEAQSHPRDSALYHQKLHELARLMEEKPHVPA